MIWRRHGTRIFAWPAIHLFLLCNRPCSIGVSAFLCRVCRYNFLESTDNEHLNDILQIYSCDWNPFHRMGRCHFGSWSDELGPNAQINAGYDSWRHNTNMKRTMSGTNDKTLSFKQYIMMSTINFVLAFVCWYAFQGSDRRSIFTDVTALPFPSSF